MLSTELSRADESNGNAVHLEDSARQPNVTRSDEAELQFHQPDESITGATVIADARVATPEQIIASDELLRLIASSLRDLVAALAKRSSFMPSKVSAVEEIVAITGRTCRPGARLRFRRARPLAQGARAGQAIPGTVRSNRRCLIQNPYHLWGDYL